MRKRGYAVLESKGDFRILRSLNENPKYYIQILVHYFQTSTHEMKDARKREVDFSVRPNDQVIEID